MSRSLSPFQLISIAALLFRPEYPCRYAVAFESEVFAGSALTIIGEELLEQRRSVIQRYAKSPLSSIGDTYVCSVGIETRLLMMSQASVNLSSRGTIETSSLSKSSVF